jgi:PEP-CTERM motif
MFGAIAGGITPVSPCRLSSMERGTTVKRPILLISSLVAGGALVGAGPAKAALVHDLVTFSANGFEIDVGSDPAPVDPVTGSFTISFDPTLTYTDETAGITLTPGSLNIALDSALSFSYNAAGSGLPTGTLVVGGLQAGAQMVQFMPSSNDFWLFINTFATAPAFDQVGYSQTSVASVNNLFDTHDGSVTVTPVMTPTPVPEPSTWTMMFLGFAGLGFLGYRQTAKARAAA